MFVLFVYQWSCFYKKKYVESIYDDKYISYICVCYIDNDILQGIYWSLLMYDLLYIILFIKKNVLVLLDLLYRYTKIKHLEYKVERRHVLHAVLFTLQVCCHSFLYCNGRVSIIEVHFVFVTANSLQWTRYLCLDLLQSINVIIIIINNLCLYR